MANCLEYAEQRTESCAQYADQGYNACTQYRDDGYNSCSAWDAQCCTWWPCSWACKLVTWACLGWYWVSNLVCVAWHWVANVVCVLWTIVTTLVCAVWEVVVTIVSVVITILEAVFGWLLSLAALLVELIFAIPYFGRILQWIWNVIVLNLVYLVVNLVDGFLYLIGVRPQKKLRICTITPARRGRQPGRRGQRRRRHDQPRDRRLPAGVQRPDRQLGAAPVLERTVVRRRARGQLVDPDRLWPVVGDAARHELRRAGLRRRPKGRRARVPASRRDELLLRELAERRRARHARDGARRPQHRQPHPDLQRLLPVGQQLPHPLRGVSPEGSAEHDARARARTRVQPLPPDRPDEPDGHDLTGTGRIDAPLLAGDPDPRVPARQLL